MRIISGSDVRAITRLASVDQARDPQVEATAAQILADVCPAALRPRCSDTRACRNRVRLSAALHVRDRDALHVFCLQPGPIVAANPLSLALLVGAFVDEELEGAARVVVENER